MKEPRWNAIKNPKGYAERMNKRDRIDFILKYGSEVQVDGMKSILRYPHRENTYTIERESIWERTDKGRRIVENIIKRKLGLIQFGPEDQ